MKTYDLKGAAEFLCISPDSMRDMADSGKVPAAKIGPAEGRRWVFTDEALEEYLRDEIRQQTAKRRTPLQAVAPIARVPGRRKSAPPPSLAA